MSVQPLHKMLNPSMGTHPYQALQHVVCVCAEVLPTAPKECSHAGPCGNRS